MKRPMAMRIEHDDVKECFEAEGLTIVCYEEREKGLNQYRVRNRGNEYGICSINKSSGYFFGATGDTHEIRNSISRSIHTLIDLYEGAPFTRFPALLYGNWHELGKGVIRFPEKNEFLLNSNNYEKVKRMIQKKFSDLEYEKQKSGFMTILVYKAEFLVLYRVLLELGYIVEGYSFYREMKKQKALRFKDEYINSKIFEDALYEIGFCTGTTIYKKNNQ